MELTQVINFLNAIQKHYLSDDFDQTKSFKKEDVIRLYIENGSIQNIFKTLVQQFEKEVLIDESYINQVFNDFKINPEDANTMLKEMSVPKEPTFSKKALIKKPTFSKSSTDLKVESDSQEREINKMYNTPPLNRIHDKSDGGLNLISFLIPLVGIIYYAVHNDTKPVKSSAALTSSLVAVGLLFVIYLIGYN